MGLLEDISVKIRLQPKQQRLWQAWDESDASVVGDGGARGGSKSGGCRRCMVLRRLKYANTTGIILRQTFPQLEKSHILKFQEEFPELAISYHGQRHEVRFPNGSVLYFGHGRAMADYNSAEFADILFDEGQEFSQRQIEAMDGANRCTTNQRIRPKKIIAFMPGHTEDGLPPIGLSYLKRVLVDGDLKPEEQKKKWTFVQAFAWDNIEWFRSELRRDGYTCEKHTWDDEQGDKCLVCMRIQEREFYSWPEAQRRDYFIERTDFGQKLSAVTDSALRDAWLYGKWGSFEGQFFKHWLEARKVVDEEGDEESIPWHVISRAEARERIKPWHFKWVSGDWGFDHPFTVLWHAIDELNRVITYREYWGREVHETDLGREIGRLGAGEKLGSFPFSWEAGKLSSRAPAKFPKSIEQLVREGLPKGHPYPHPIDSSPGSRIARARLVSNALKTVIEGIPQWQISEDCPHLIECIPSLIRDPAKPEDVLKVDWSENGIGDDPYDAAAGGLQYKLRGTTKPREVEQAEKLAKIEDPTHRQMEYLRMEAENKRRRQPETMVGDWRRRLEEQ